MGNFMGQFHDLLYLHNQAAERPIPRRWFKWADEYFSSDDGTQLIRKQSPARKKCYADRGRPTGSFSGSTLGCSQIPSQQ